MAEAVSPRPKTYPNIGLGRPSSEPCNRPKKPITAGRLPTVSHLIRILEKEVIVPDSEEENTSGDEANLFGGPLVRDHTEAGPSGSSGRQVEDNLLDLEAEEGGESVDEEGETSTDEANLLRDVVDIESEEDRDEEEGETSTDEANLLRDVVDIECEEDGDEEDGDTTSLEGSEEESSDEEDNDWEDGVSLLGSASGSGSSDEYTAESESLGYITVEEDDMLGAAVERAIVEASLEDTKMDRAEKRVLLRNVDLAELRAYQVRKLIDEIDIGSIIRDRVDLELQRIGLEAESVLRMLHNTDAVMSGSFLFPGIGPGWLIPNDLDLFATLDEYKTILTYLKRKGFTTSKQVYPQKGAGRRRRAYGSELQGISLIFELQNKGSYKINVIVSTGRAILPILQFHSTHVMNYIAYHGLVCLYEITLHQLSVANYSYSEDIPIRVMRCFDKYRSRGFEISDSFEEDHVCKVAGSCPQTVRSLFDQEVIHVRFPEHVDKPAGTLRKEEAQLALWRLATGGGCRVPTIDNAGFVICDSDFIQFKR